MNPHRLHHPRSSRPGLAWIATLCLFALGGCSPGIPELEEEVRVLRERVAASVRPVEEPSVRPVALRATSAPSPFLDLLKLPGHGSARPMSRQAPTFGTNAFGCEAADLEFRGWIRDARVTQAWVRCPGKPVRAVSAGDALDDEGAWVAAIAPREIWIYPGADDGRASSTPIAVPLLTEGSP